MTAGVQDVEEKGVVLMCFGCHGTSFTRFLMNSQLIVKANDNVFQWEMQSATIHTRVG